MLIIAQTKSRPSPNVTASLILGELQPVLEIFRREQCAVLKASDVLGTVDDLQMPGLLVKEAGVAGLHISIRR